jgi:DNA polymerase-3 subunit delta'
MKILGNKKIVDSLNRAIEKKVFVQSYLFCGPEALGKFLVAKEFAEKLTGNGDGAVDLNLLVIEPEIEEKDDILKEKEIKLESIKKLQKEFSLTSFSKNHRVAIIRSAQKLNISAQNSLLKILEEPPENTIIILIAEDEKKLLPTIISRCQIKRFSLLSEAELSGMIDEALPNREELIFWSLGRPGLACNLLDKKVGLEEKRELVRELQSLFSMSGNEKLLCAEALSKNTPLLLEKMDFWIILLRGVILGQKSLITSSPVKALKLIERIEGSKRTIKSTNSNVRLVVENLVLAF